MSEALMKYKEYEWKQNPETIEVSYEKGLCRWLLPFEGSLVQDLGPKGRVIKGDGAFFGENCMQEFLALSFVLQENGPGLLSLPGMEPFYAVVRSFGLSRAPGPNVVGYRFEFWESTAPAPAAAQKTQSGEGHLVQSGETLFSIAAQYEKTVEELLEKNPAVRRPDELTPGQRLVVL